MSETKNKGESEDKSKGKSAGADDFLSLEVTYGDVCEASFSALVRKDELERRRDEMVAKIMPHVKLPGFRPGKAPVAVVARRFAKKIEEDLTDSLRHDIYAKLGESEGLELLMLGEVRREEMSDAGEFVLEQEITFKPKFKLPNYKGIKVEESFVKATEQDVEAAMQSWCERFATYDELGEQRPLAQGDVAVLDYEGFLAGSTRKPLAELEPKPPAHLVAAKGFWAEMKGEDNVILPGFEAAILGMAKGQSKEIELVAPEDMGALDLGGKSLLYTVDLKEIRVKKLPEMTDEFCKEKMKLSSLAEFKEILEHRLNGEKFREVYDKACESILKFLRDNTKFDLPKNILKLEAQGIVDNIVQDSLRRGAKQDDISKEEGKIVEASKLTAEKNLRNRFILEELAKTESLQVEENEIAQELHKIAVEQGKKPDEVFKEFKQDAGLENLRGQMLWRKTIRLLFENATYEDEDTRKAFAPTEEEIKDGGKS